MAQRGPGLDLLERDPELARIEAGLARARAGEGALLVVAGPAGIGKTALLAEARARAGGAGMRVLAARGAQLEREFGFGVVRQLAEPALAALDPGERAEVLAGAAGLAAQVLALPGAEPAEAAAADASFAVLHGLYWLCANLSAREPLVMGIDDAQWADAPSLRFVAHLLPRLPELPIALVLALRPDEPDAPALLAAITADPAAETVAPGPLSLTGVGRMIAAGGAAVDPGFAAAARSVTGGVPFLVRELLATLEAEGVAPTAEAAGALERLGARRVGRAVLARLKRLGPDAAALAEAVAVLERAELPLAAAVAGLDAAAAATAADALVGAGMLEPGRPLAFAHPILRTSVYAELPRARRAAQHRRAAGELAGWGEPGERIVEHLLAAEPEGDPWVVEQLEEVARRAVARGAPESAAAYLERALTEPPPRERRGAILVALGTAADLARRPDALRHFEEAARIAVAPADRVTAAVMRAHVLAREERSADAITLLDEVAADLGPLDAGLEQMLETIIVAVGMVDARTAPAIAGRIAALRRSADDPAAPRPVLGMGALIAALANEPAAVAAGLAERALAAGPTTLPDPTDLPWFPGSCLALTLGERAAVVRPVLDRAAAHAVRTGDSVLLIQGLLCRAWLRALQGDLAGSESDARTAVAARQDYSFPLMFRLFNSGVLVRSLVAQGKLAEAQAALAMLGPEVDGSSQAAAMLRHARAGLWAAQRRTDAALAELLALGAQLETALASCSAYVPWRSDAALLHLARGEGPQAVALADAELALAQAFGAPVALAVALRVAGLARGEEALLRDALAVAANPLEDARARTALGAFLRRANRRAEARDLLAAALDAAHRAGAGPLADHADAELRATGARPRRVQLSGPESLTASERRVAELAAEGLTNREIAQALFVTARTVEGHLTQAFRKLDVTTRAALPDALGVPA